MTAVPPAAPPSNPYRDVTIAANSVSYSIDRDGDATITGGEPAGFRLSGNVIQVQTGAGGWQALTDPQTVQITAFNITNSATTGRIVPGALRVVDRRSCFARAGRQRRRIRGRRLPCKSQGRN